MAAALYSTGDGHSIAVISIGLLALSGTGHWHNMVQGNGTLQVWPTHWVIGTKWYRVLALYSCGQRIGLLALYGAGCWHSTAVMSTVNVASYGAGSCGQHIGLLALHGAGCWHCMAVISTVNVALYGARCWHSTAAVSRLWHYAVWVVDMLQLYSAERLALHAVRCWHSTVVISRVMSRASVAAGNSGG